MGQSGFYGGVRLLAVGLLLPLAGGFGPIADEVDAALSDTAASSAGYRVPGSNAVVRLWESEGAAGAKITHYAISLDGGRIDVERPASTLLRLKYAAFDPFAFEPDVPESLRAGEGNRLFLIQFQTPMIAPYRAALEAAGVSLIKFVADQGYVVEMETEAAGAARSLPFVRWVGAFHPAYRLDPALIPGLCAAQYEQAEGAGAAAEEGGAVLGFNPVRRGEEGVEYSIMMTRRGPVPQEAVAARIIAMGGTVHQTIPQGFRIRATLTPQQLVQVLNMNEVLYVDEQGVQENDMDIARQIGGATFLESTLGISGEGVRAEVMDDGVRATHEQFRGEVIVHSQNSGGNSHGTSTFGIVFATGTGNTQATGMLPDAEARIICDYDLVLNQSSNRYGLTAELVDPNGPYRAVFQSNSWGNTRTRSYTTISAEMDDISFINDIIICQSQSNAGNQDSRPQAWAKNIVSVGGIRHQNTLTKSDDTWSSGGSTGPAADGRIKPDLTHFYDNIFTTSSSSDIAYTSSFGGTSGATPITAGHFGLMFQMWHEEVFPGFGGGSSVFDSRPGLATAKALMINSAEQYAFSGSSHDRSRDKQGWGMADLARLYNERERMLIVDETELLGELQTARYTVTVGPATPELKVTLVFKDLMGNPSGQVARINDLTLKVTAPDSTVYWGNNNMRESNYTAPGGSPNTVDTVENVFVQNPAVGTWTIEVTASELNEDAWLDTPGMDAAFALVASGITGFSGGMRITMSGACPGEVTASWQDAPTNVVMGVVFALATGNAVVPSGPCAGTVLGLGTNQLQLVTTVNSGGGSGSVSGQVGNPVVCDGYLQLIEAGACGTSNVVRVRP
ncbi:MAG: S8 family serine peptidase [Phycisphaerales bacterium]|nr:S8 family serine peptidase [Phycisphaerales bacterium]